METISANSCTIEIRQEEIYVNPRKEFDCHYGTLVCFHRRYDLGDENPSVSPEEYLLQMMQEREMQRGKWWVPDDIDQKHVDAYIQKHYICLPVYLYDHSGLTMKTTPFGCPWDSGKVGFIYIDRESTAYPDLAEGLRQEIETFNQYLTGDVWSFTIKDADGDVLDSCGGIMGIDYCRSEALLAASHLKG